MIDEKELAEIQDRSRVRTRMGLDMSEQLRLLKSEVETYGDYFSEGEREQIKALIQGMRLLRRKLLG